MLAHGAGAGQSHPFMAGAARGLAARGLDVLTFDFPYMAAGRKLPDRLPVLTQCFREVIDGVRRWNPDLCRRLVIGGKSMGGRMATHLAAEGVEGLAGTIVLGYPLHPPGRPDRPRVAHLPAIATPVLIVQGERDAFGTPDELRPVIAGMTAPVTLHVVAGADHSLTVRGRAKDEAFGVMLDEVAAWIRRPRVH